MQTSPGKELLLTTLAVRDSRNCTARFKLGRLIALFAGIATVLLMAGHHPAKAAGMSSMLPEGAGLSISVPLGDVSGPAARPTVQIFALVGGEDPVRFDVDRPVRRERVAFASIALAGGMAGVAAWPSRQHPAVRSARNRNASAVPLRTVRRAPVRSALVASGVRQAHPAQKRVNRVEARRSARLATLSYQKLLRQYQMLPQHAPRAHAHARLMSAYRVAVAWRTVAAWK
jgi:hypothetical protein